jgi:hypothetical protein
VLCHRRCNYCCYYYRHIHDEVIAAVKAKAGIDWVHAVAAALSKCNENDSSIQEWNGLGPGPHTGPFSAVQPSTSSRSSSSADKQINALTDADSIAIVCTSSEHSAELSDKLLKAAAAISEHMPATAYYSDSSASNGAAGSVGCYLGGRLLAQTSIDDVDTCVAEVTAILEAAGTAAH